LAGEEVGVHAGLSFLAVAMVSGKSLRPGFVGGDRRRQNAQCGHKEHWERQFGRLHERDVLAGRSADWMNSGVSWLGQDSEMPFGFETGKGVTTPDSRPLPPASVRNRMKTKREWGYGKVKRERKEAVFWVGREYQRAGARQAAGPQVEGDFARLGRRCSRISFNN